MKQYYIRKQVCGCYSIFKVIDIVDIKPNRINKSIFKLISDKYDFMVIEVAHLETFGDVLVLLNVRVNSNDLY